MNQEQIIKMARHEGIAIGFGLYEDQLACFSLVLLENFAYAVRAATKDEDAKICASIAEQTVMSDNYQAKECESCIRASK